jgi:ribose 5-phosphate isomerase RpiB
MRIVVGSDHGGYSLKHDMVAALRQDGHDVLDVTAEERHARRPSQGHRDLQQAAGMNGESL